MSLNKDKIFITGFMGVGKTTVGRYLAKKYGYHFFDLDEEIKKEMNTSLDALLEEKGISFFRKKEEEILPKVCSRSKTVISLGGGTLMSIKNLEYVQGQGVLIFLEGDMSTLQNRLQKSYKRPLLKDIEVSTLQSLYEERKSHYEKADIRIKTTGLSVEDVFQKIEEGFGTLPT